MENKPSSVQFSLKGSLDIIFRHKIIMFATFAVITFLALIALQFVTPVFDANVKMLIRGQSVTAAETYTPIITYSIQSTQAEIVKSYPVLKRAAIALNLQNRPFDYEKKYSSKLKQIFVEYQAAKAEKYFKRFSQEQQQQMKLSAGIDDLRRRLTVNLLPGTDIFIINVTALSPTEAVETANVISRSYTIFDQLQQLAEISLRYGESHPTVVQLKDNIKYATENLSGRPLPDIEAIGTASVKIIEQATTTNAPVGRPKKMLFIIALIMAGCTGFGVAFIYGTLDHSLKTPQEIVEHLDVPCIGSIPKKKRKESYLINEQSPLTEYTEYYEDLTEQLHVFLKTQGMESALITSPAYNSNHKYIVPNIGYLLTQTMGHTALLIDANFHKPNFQEIYNLPNDTGENIDSESNEISKAIKNNPDTAQASSITLHIIQNLITKINGGPDILLTSKFPHKISTIHNKIDLKAIVKIMKKEYDVILIDATSINNMRDISSISECSDGTVLVIDEGKLQREMMKNSLPILRKKNIKIIGSILNNRTFPIPEFIYRRFKYLID